MASLAAKFLKSAALAFAVACFTQETKAQVTVFTDTVDNVDYTMEDALRGYMAQTALGRALVAFGDSAGVEVIFSDSIRQRGFYDVEKNRILIYPGQPDDEAVLVLANEYRQAWQEKSFGMTALLQSLLSPQDMWALQRISTADAFAFMNYFAADRAAQGFPLALSEVFSRDMDVIAKLAAEMTGDGLTPGEYREIAFETALAETGRKQMYDVIHMAGAARPVQFLQQAFRQAGDRSPDMSSMLATTPDSAAFESLLRRFGGMNLDPAAATTLQDPALTARRLLGEYPYLVSVYIDSGFEVSAPNPALQRMQADYRRLMARVKP